MASLMPSTDGDGEEDVVVRELDVYLNDNIDLYLMQYVLRPAHAPAPNIKHAEYKPKHKILEVYTEHHAKRDGHLKLCSTVAPHKAQLGVAILSEDGLHITPLQDVLPLETETTMTRTRREPSAPCSSKSC
jgi:hypothetical protein